MRLKNQVSLIGRSKTDRIIRKETSCTNHIYFFRYDGAGKGVECCFKKAGISERELEKLLNDEDDPFAGLDEIDEDTVQTMEANLAALKEEFGDQTDAHITSDDYIDFDIVVITTHGKLTNQEILAEINDVNEESDVEEEDPNDSEPINKPGIEDAREILQVLEDFSLFSKFGESMLKSLKELNRSLDREELSHKKQSVITSFFSKQ